MSVERQKARARGTAAEWLAAAFLRAKGYRVLARQFRAQGGELDIGPHAVLDEPHNRLCRGPRTGHSRGRRIGRRREKAAR